jgi:hypothetical protein
MVHSIVSGLVFTVMVLLPCAIAYVSADRV